MKLRYRSSNPPQRNHFAQFGKVERIKKIRDYAFVHFVDREGAEAAMNQGESQMLDGAMVEISFAKECVFYDFNYIIIV